MRDRVPGHAVVVGTFGDNGPATPAKAVDDRTQAPDAGIAGGDRIDGFTAQQGAADQVNLVRFHREGYPAPGR